MATILYVEDHPPAQLLMQAIVSTMTPHTLLLASSGAEALARTHTIPPDLYILDLDLPDDNGLTLAAKLNDIRPAPIILISAYAEAIDPAALPPSIQYYLAKPLDPDDVAKTIQRALA